LAQAILTQGSKQPWSPAPGSHFTHPRAMLVIGRDMLVAITLLGLLDLGESQQAGNMENEEGPMITLKECTLAGGCTSNRKRVTLDANWRWIHKVGGYDNCYTGNMWDKSVCDQDGAGCAQNCAIEGIPLSKYESTYGVSQIEDGVKLKFVTRHTYGVNVGSRLYVLDDDNSYFMFQLKNREFALDIDVSTLHCGMNGAMYFVEMDETGGKNLGNNQAGAKYGTGYCDAQCPHDIKFINGEANCVDWRPNDKDEGNNMGIGKYGSCCAEMDIWEANSMATAYTPHPCNLGNSQKPAQFRCEGTDCGDNDKNERYQGVCDKDGCDINPFRMGNQTFYGRGPEFIINTLKPMTVVTQFITSDNTDTGDLVEIRRFYRQEGRIIHSPPTKILGNKSTDSITDQFCSDKKELFDDVNDFMRKGGNRAMGDSLDRGQVLALSLWDDVEVNMLWLDSAFPLDKDREQPGVLRGDCPGGEQSTPTYVREQYPDSYVTFKNAAIGEIGSTLLGGGGGGGGGSCGTGTCQGRPECTGKDEPTCLHLANEGKCTWTPGVPCTTAAPTTATTPTPNPTPAPTSSPTQAPGLCKPWCSTNSKPWSKKCKWDKCKGCSSCQTTSGQCKSWCANNAQDWSKKCLWDKCEGCSACANGVRRLRGSKGRDEILSDEELLV